MKNTLILLMTLLTGTSALAQLSIEDTFYSASGQLNQAEYVFYTRVVNTGKAAVTPHWRRLEDTHPSGWFSQVCIGDLCYAAEVSSGTFVEPLFGGDTSEISIHITDDGATGGEARVVVVIFDPADSAGNHVSATFEYGEYPSGISSANSDKKFLLLSPNPAGDVLYTEMAKRQGGEFSMTIFELSGRRVLQYRNVKSQRSAFDISQLPPGSYLLIAKDKKSGQEYSGKFLKQ